MQEWFQIWHNFHFSYQRESSHTCTARFFSNNNKNRVKVTVCNKKAKLPKSYAIKGQREILAELSSLYLYTNTIEIKFVKEGKLAKSWNCLLTYPKFKIIKRRRQAGSSGKRVMSKKAHECKHARSPTKISGEWVPELIV